MNETKSNNLPTKTVGNCTVTDSSKHKSFYGFFPSKFFAFDGSILEEAEAIEGNVRSIEDLKELKSIYMKAIPSAFSDEIIMEKCEYAKEILRISISDLDFFSANSQRTSSELIPLFSLLVSVLALGFAAFGTAYASVPVFGFGIIVTIGSSMTYIISCKMRENSNKLKEYYRKMLMCFETVELIVKEKQLKK